MPGPARISLEDIVGPSSQRSPTSQSISTTSASDETVQPENLTSSPPLIDVNSPEGKNIISNLKRYFCMAEDAPNEQLHRFVNRVREDLEKNVHLIGMHGYKYVIYRSKRTGKCKVHPLPVSVPRHESSRQQNQDIIKQFDSLGWKSYFKSVYDRADVNAYKWKVKKKPRISESQIRTFRAVPKVNPFDLPAPYVDYVPKKRSPLSLVTVIAEKGETRTMEPSRVNNYVPVDPVPKFVPEDSLWSFINDYDSSCSEGTSTSSSAQYNVGSNGAADTADAGHDMWGYDAAFQFDDTSVSSVPSEPGVSSNITSNNCFVSYRTPQGQQLMQTIQGYLGRPDGEQVSETSRWMISNHRIMESIRLHDACVTLPALVRLRIAEGHTDEALAQFEARTELMNAIAMLDWDEIDNEPIF